MIIDIVKVFLPTALSFIVGILITPIISHYLYKFQLWKKKSVSTSIDGHAAVISAQLHRDEIKKTPRMGGIVVWMSVLITATLVWLFGYIFNGEIFGKLDFVSRSQTWIPLAALLIGALVGLIDDFAVTREVDTGSYIGGGLSLTKRLLVVGGLGLLAALWFYYKLDVHTVGFPLISEIDLGWWFIAFFVFVVIATYSGSVIDGIDGLAGGVLAAAFSAYAGIAFYQQQIDLAAFCAVVVGGILAFLWFNIPPARFYMSETGMMGLTVTLAIVAFMTDSLAGGRGVMVLPIIAFPLVISAGSDIIQILSKRFRGKKVFLVAPIHHHFEALGWAREKITMRYWIVSVVCAIIGMILALVA
jgi:phospho-N-acetylmuramoyl-pentapeptide-transferase